jgi:YD repeat-containing protein
MNRPNGINTAYNYDNLSRLLSVLHQAGPANVDGASYGGACPERSRRDHAGNRTSKLNLLNGVNEHYSYDALYQLTQVLQDANGGTLTNESYSFDKVGNRLSSLGLDSWLYNSSNQLTSTPSSSFTGACPERSRRDNSGNMLTKADANGTATYTWDFENRLASAFAPATGTTTFRYDPFGRRIQKSGPLGTTTFVYDGANIVAEYDGTGALAAKYAHGAGVDQPLAMWRAGQIGFYQADGLGSITSLTDSARSPLATYTYDAFGRTTATGTLFNPFQYTGREWDAETGLYYYRARYYDANAAVSRPKIP